MDQALSGVRIIDMTHNQAGPACTQILGFLGADVIKLEEPKGGDIARVNMRDQKNSDSLFFLILNANKRSLTLNLKTDAGKDLFRKVRDGEMTILEAAASSRLDNLLSVIFGYYAPVYGERVDDPPEIAAAVGSTGRREMSWADALPTLKALGTKPAAHIVLYSEKAAVTFRYGGAGWQTVG